MRQFRADADRQHGEPDVLDPVHEGARHGLAPHVSRQLWTRIAREIVDGDDGELRARFRELAAAAARRHAQVGKRTLVEAERGELEPAMMPGKRTLVEVETQRWGPPAAAPRVASRGRPRRDAWLRHHRLVPSVARSPAIAAFRAAASLQTPSKERPERFLELVASSQGAPLPAELAARWGARFGHAFDHVRVHLDRAAAAAAEAISARAFTMGSRVFFAAGAFDPATRTGDALIAHELAHVVQHDRGRADAASAHHEGVAISSPGDAVERDADDLAAGALSTPSHGPRPGAERSEPVAAAPTALEPSPVRRYADGDADDGVLLLNVAHGGTTIDYAIDLTPPQQAAFSAAPDKARRLAVDIESTFNPRSTPLFEGTSFLASAAVRDRIRRDLPGWLAGGGLAITTAFLADRQRALRGLAFLYDLERHLASQGYAPGTIDWLSVVPALLAEPPPVPATTLIQASIQDRYHLFLRALHGEASERPSVVAPIAASAGLGALVRDYVDHLPTASWGPDAPSIYSEAFLARWTLELAALEYIPDGFDLARFDPAATQAALDAEREALVSEFVTDWMPGLVTQYVMDSWSTSGMTEEGFLERIDMDALRGRILDQLTAEFMRRAGTDPRYRRALANAAVDQARFRTFGFLLAAGRNLERSNADLIEKFAHTPATDLDDWHREIAADPYGYYRDSSAIADSLFGLLTRVESGSDLGAALDAVTSPAEPAFGGAVALIAVFNVMRSLKDERARQTSEARDGLRAQLDLSYDEVAQTIRTMWDFADEFIENQYIPKLKEIALRRVTENRDQLQSWLTHWDTRTPRLIATYRLSAFALRDVVGKLERGEVSSATIESTVITIDNVQTLRDAATAMEALAERLESEDGAQEKKDELQEAIDAFEDVRENIEDDEYPPWEWGRAVVAEAREALGIGAFPEFTTYGLIFSGQSHASRNPFLARAIATWEFRERHEPSLAGVLVFVALGLLTVASLLAPGVAGLVLGALDIAAGVGTGIHGVVQAQEVLDLALLDPDLELHGISVEQAREALHSAWVGLALAVLIPVGIAGFFGVLRLMRGTTALAGLRGLGNLQRAIEIDPVLVEHLMRQVRDAEKLDSLLGLAGEAPRLQRLLAHTADVAQAERLLMHGVPAARMVAWVESLGSGSRMAALLDRVPDAMTLELLVARYGDDIVKLEGHLVALGTDGAAALRLERLLDNAGGVAGIERALVYCDDLFQFERLTTGMIPAERVIQLLETTRSGTTLETLLLHCDDAGQIELLLLYGLEPARLAALVERGGGTRMLAILERVPDVATVERLAGTYGDDMIKLEAHLVGLGSDASAAGRLDALVATTRGLPGLEALLPRFDDIDQLARVAREIESVEDLTTLLDAVGSGSRLAAFVEHAGGGGAAGIRSLLRNVGTGDHLAAFLGLVDADPSAAIALARTCDVAPGLSGRLAHVFGDRALTSLTPEGNMVRFADETSVSPITLNSPEYTDDVIRRLMDACDNPAAARAEFEFFQREPYRLRFNTNVDAMVNPWIARVTSELGLTEAPPIFRNMSESEAARLFECLRDVKNNTVRTEGTRWALRRNPENVNQFVAYLEFFEAEVVRQREAVRVSVQRAIDAASEAEQLRCGGRPLKRSELDSISQQITARSFADGGVGRSFPRTTGDGFKDHVRDVIAREIGTNSTAITHVGGNGPSITTTRAEIANAAWQRNIADMIGPYTPARVGLGIIDDAGLPRAIQAQCGRLSFGDVFSGSYHTHKHVRDDLSLYSPGGSDVHHFVDRARDVIHSGSPQGVRYNPDGSRSVSFVRNDELAIVRIGINGDATIATYMPVGAR